MWNDFQAKKLNTHVELELKFPANRAASENQAELVTVFDHGQINNFKKWNPPLCPFTM